MNPLDWTNAMKGAIFGVIVAIAGVATSFGVNLTQEQTGAVVTLAGALFALYVIATKDKSPRWAGDAAPQTYTIEQIQQMLREAYGIGFGSGSGSYTFTSGNQPPPPTSATGVVVPPRPTAGTGWTASPNTAPDPTAPPNTA